MKLDAGPLESLLQEIERAIDLGLWHSALAVTLSLPDICSLLTEEKPWSHWKKYSAWYDENLGDRFGDFTGLDCFRIRGGVLHRAQFSHRETKYTQFAFTLRRPGVVLGHGTMSWEGQYVKTIDLLHFCHAMTEAVRKWYAVHRENEVVQRNVATVVRYRARGEFGNVTLNVPIIG